MAVPSYEEYKSATAFARFKYRFGLVIIIFCWLCLIFIIYYMVTNTESISRNPLIYGADKYDVECYCSSPERGKLYVNGTTLITIEDGMPGSNWCSKKNE